MLVDQQLDELSRAGWTVTRAANDRPLPSNLRARYPGLSGQVAGVLMSLETCVNPQETAWLLCRRDLEGQSDSAFAWNEWERMSLAAAGRDEQLQSEIRSHWDNHFPLLLSVKAGYSYYALVVAGERAGSIVHGFEPLFEDCSPEFESFDAFLAALTQAARGEAGGSSLAATV